MIGLGGKVHSKTSCFDGYQGLFGVLFFCFAGPSIIFLNKHLLSSLNFHYPITLCLLQDFLALTVSWTAVRVLKLVKLPNESLVTWRFYITRIVPVGFFLTGSLVLG
jgi:hypothetical protein